MKSTSSFNFDLLNSSAFLRYYLVLYCDL